MGDGRPRLIVHIGGAKCGSSAIQAFLNVNSGRLREAGVLVPSNALTDAEPRTGEQINFFNEGHERNGGDERAFQGEVRGLLARLERSMDADGLHTAVISAENLINPLRYHVLFHPDGRFAVEIVTYVRRQDDFMISAWQQWQLKQHESFAAYYEAMPRDGDWYHRLDRWLARFGDASMTVRLFQRDQLAGGNVVDDFCGLLDLNIEDYERPGLMNRTLHERLGVLANRHRKVLFSSLDDNRFYTFVQDLLGEAVYRNYAGSALLSLAERQAIMADYEESNRLLQRQYFPDLDEGEPLFAPPTLADVADHIDLAVDDLSDRIIVALFERSLVTGEPATDGRRGAAVG